MSNKALVEFHAELARTGVISESFKARLIGYAQAVALEAFAAGKAAAGKPSVEDLFDAVVEDFTTKAPERNTALERAYANRHSDGSVLVGPFPPMGARLHQLLQDDQVSVRGGRVTINNCELAALGNRGDDPRGCPMCGTGTCPAEGP